MIDINTKKKILCYNMIQYKQCRYGNNCTYAHSLLEQQVNKSRKYMIELIIGNTNLEKLNLLNDNYLDTLTIFTKLCQQCVNKKCLGGYNCKYGACDVSCCICYEDFIYGNCQKIKCNFIHLTDRGLVPYTVQKKINKNKNLDNNINNYANINLFKVYMNYKTKTSSESDSYEDEDVQAIIDYIHN